ncbi:MAG: hypothetical protein ABWX70_12745 [Hyphomicrobium sp.]
MSKLSIAALVSAGRHPVSGVPRACRGDAVAMALAHALAGGAVRVVHAGNANEPSLREYMAYGARTIEVVPVAADANIVAPLAANLRDADIIFTGIRAEKDAGSGLLPYMLADALGRPPIANVLELSIERGTTATDVKVRQFLPKGQRRQIACPMPVVIAVHPYAPVELKYAYARQKSGRIAIAPLTPSSSEALRPEWMVEAAPRRPVRLKVQAKKAGHERLLSAIASEAKGGVVAFEGTSVDKAQVVLNYLREHRLVDF